MSLFSILYLHLISLFFVLQPKLVLAGLSNGVYLISQKPLVQLGSSTYYLSLSGASEKVQLQTLREGSADQRWEIKNTAGGITLKNTAFGCYGHVGSLWQVLPIGAPLFCSSSSVLSPQIFQAKETEDGTFRVLHFDWSDPSLFYLMHTVPLDPTLGLKNVYGNITFIPAATKFATYFRFERIGVSVSEADEDQ